MSKNKCTFVRKKGNHAAPSNTAQPDTDMREQGSQGKTAHPAIVPTEIGIPSSSAKEKSGVSSHKRSTSDGPGTNTTASQAKRKKRKTENKRNAKCTSPPLACLSTCPTEVLELVIGFLRGPLRASSHRDFLNLRLVNRRFRYLLQPIVFESVEIPGRNCSGWSVSKDVRKLLRLIDLNPSLATCIKDLNYGEFHQFDVEEVEYSVDERKHDRKILSKFVEETGLQDLTGMTWEHILQRSRLREMSKLYEIMCIPLLLARLTNLRMLGFEGHVGGGYAFLLTPWAKEIWEHTPLRSLEVLRWQPWHEDLAYQSIWWPSHYIHHYSSVSNKEKPPNNDWNVISFLQFTPALKQLTFTNDVFLARATPESMPILPSLTSIRIESGHAEETSQFLMKLVNCTPKFKTVETLPGAAFRASVFKEALRQMRHSIEEMDINGEFKRISDTNGGIGPLKDFTNLIKISTNLSALYPLSRTGWSEDSSLLELLPPNLEYFHLRISDKDIDQFKFEQFNPHLSFEFQFQRISEPIWRLYQLLEHVALAKESGVLSKLRSISIDDQSRRVASSQSSEEGLNRLAALCTSLGIEWKRSGDDINESRLTERYSEMDLQRDWEPDWQMNWQMHWPMDGEYDGGELSDSLVPPSPE
ncbi:hypothetical protein BZA77DRAFT_291868 [Pyronema omphalodes]|nr:hypothetical protein BZA77DRAFT_291868 [Pyronema omphalodes]